MTESPPNKPLLKERLQTLLVEYGSLALWVYFGIFASVLIGFATAIKLGVQVESAAGAVGTWGAAYVATKVTQPIRILATLVLTPLIMRIVRRFKRSPKGGDPTPATK